MASMFLYFPKFTYTTDTGVELTVQEYFFVNSHYKEISPPTGSLSIIGIICIEMIKG